MQVEQVTPKPFSVWQVGPDFDYRAFLNRQASRIVNRYISGAGPRFIDFIPHPLAPDSEDPCEGSFVNIGEVYFRQPDILPPSLLKEFEGNATEAARWCVRLEKIDLQESFQRRGFISMLATGFKVAGYRYLILSTIQNKPWARHLYKATLQAGSRYELLSPVPFQPDGHGLPVFALRLQ
jgi:hypothetical protein